MSEFGEGRKRRWFTPEERREALRVLEECGGRVSEAARRLGCSKAALRKWRDSGPDPKPRSAVLRLPPEAKAAVADAVLAGRRPAEAAAAAGVSETSARNWARERADRGEAAFVSCGVPAGVERASGADLPDDPAELKRMVLDLQLENDLMRAVVEVVKKDLGADPSGLTAEEKARVALALRGTCSVTSLASRETMI
jgi:transposase-like protein